MNAARKTLRRVLGWMVLPMLALDALAQTAGAAAGVRSDGGPKIAGIFPLSQVHRGLRGEALTVFEGVVPERMEVEILGVLRDSLGPGRDMILARLKGTKPEYTGVVAGMSGSPVYIDGRLVGALSYRIGQFSKEPIAGITPIEQMFEVRDTPEITGSAGGARGGGEGHGVEAHGVKMHGTGTHGTEAHGTEMHGTDAHGTEMHGTDAHRTEAQAIETPLVFGGFGAEAVERFGEGFRSLGLTPVSGMGGRDAKASQPEPLVPGSAVSAILVDGDLSITGTCTVTYVDATRLLACGHPITQTGAFEVPMSKAEVVATLPSPLNAFKIVNATEIVGAFTQDRASAVLGVFGKQARMIPVTVEVVPGGAASGAGAARTYHLQVLDNRQMTPQAMMVSIFQTLQQTNASTGETSYRLTGEIGVAERGAGAAGSATVPIRGVMAPGDFNSGAVNTALFVGDRFNRIYGDQREQPLMTGVRLHVEVMPERKTEEVVSARTVRSELRAGEPMEVEVTLHPYHAPAQTLRTTVQLPNSVPSGPMRVLVSDGGTLDRLTRLNNPAVQRSGGVLDRVAEVNRMHANDRVYVTLLEHTAQAVLPGGALTGVPLSMANVLETAGDVPKLQLAGESVMEVSAIETGYAVSGFQVLEVEIR